MDIHWFKELGGANLIGSGGGPSLLLCAALCAPHFSVEVGSGPTAAIAHVLGVSSSIIASGSRLHSLGTHHDTSPETVTNSEKCNHRHRGSPRR
eukprot:2703151-Amphidinium_carterae.1